MDLEKLKMTGAGRAIAVLTSGGDAQGDSTHTLQLCFKIPIENGTCCTFRGWGVEYYCMSSPFLTHYLYYVVARTIKPEYHIYVDITK